MSIPDLQSPRFNIFYKSLVELYGPTMTLENLATLLSVSLASLHTARARGLYMFPSLPASKELRFLTIDVASHLFLSLQAGQKRPRSPRRGRGHRNGEESSPSM